MQLLDLLVLSTRLLASFFIGLFERLLSLSVGVPLLLLRLTIVSLHVSLTRFVSILQLFQCLIVGLLKLV